MQPQMAMMPAAPGFTAEIVAPPFGTARIVLLMVVPLLSMRLIAEERRNQTLPFLMSAPRIDHADRAGQVSRLWLRSWRSRSHCSS